MEPRDVLAMIDMNLQRGGSIVSVDVSGPGEPIQWEVFLMDAMGRMMGQGPDVTSAVKAFMARQESTR